MDVIRILLADDHPVVRDGVRNRLDREADFSVVGEAANGEETIRQVRRTCPDVVLLDVAVPGPGAVPQRILGWSFALTGLCSCDTIAGERRRLWTN
jgi:DNA-binding NarL/FixJ family response regulator